MLTPGDPAPWFTAASTVNPTFHFHTVAGRYVVLSFFGSLAGAEARRIIGEMHARLPSLPAGDFAFCGVSIDPGDLQQGRLQQVAPSLLCFWDFQQEISRAYQATTDSGLDYTAQTIVLDEGLRVLAVFPWKSTSATHVDDLFRFLSELRPISAVSSFAPVLVAPGVFEPEFCRQLIDLYEQHGGTDSGFMRDVDGKTVSVVDYRHKRRSDYEILDQNIVRACQQRIHRRLVPEIRKAFQFSANRIERHVVGCYEAETSGHFRPHRDNTTKGTAHRRFAVSLHLNTEEYEGGRLRFPEFGQRVYDAPTGGAVVFSCSLLHEATPVVRGKRYVFLPFLYDDEAAKIRQANLQFVAK